MVVVGVGGGYFAIQDHNLVLFFIASQIMFMGEVTCMQIVLLVVRTS